MTINRLLKVGEEEDGRERVAETEGYRETFRHTLRNGRAGGEKDPLMGGESKTR